MTEPIWPDSVPWATARMVARRGLWAVVCAAFPGLYRVRDAVILLCRYYVDSVGGPYTNQLWADAFNWATAQLGFTEDYYV